MNSIYRRHLLSGTPMLTEYGKQLMTERILNMTTPSKEPNTGTQAPLGKLPTLDFKEPSVDEILRRHRLAYNIAFNEIDPHTNYQSSAEGQRAVQKRSEEIESEAKAQLLALHLGCLPEKKPMNPYMDTGSGHGLDEWDLKQAYNQALTDMEHKFREIYK